MSVIINIINAFSDFWGTYEGGATLLVILVLLFKLYVNRKATLIDYKKMFVSIPSEITFLVVGFLLSDLVTAASDADNGQNNYNGILIALVVLVIQIACEKEVNDKLAGKLSLGVKLMILIMYVSCIVLYIWVLRGGLSK